MGNQQHGWHRTPKCGHGLAELTGCRQAQASNPVLGAPLTPPPSSSEPIPSIQPRRRGSCDRLALRSRKFHGYFLHVSSICSEAAFPNLHYKATRALLVGQTFILFDTLMAKLARANELRSPAPPEADVVDQGPWVRKHRRRAQR